MRRLRHRINSKGDRVSDSVEIGMSQYGGVCISLDNDYVELSREQSEELVNKAVTLIAQSKELKYLAPAPLSFYEGSGWDENEVEASSKVPLRECLRSIEKGTGENDSDVADVFCRSVSRDFLIKMRDWCNACLSYHAQKKVN